jgi:DNA-binding transcriptional regulator YiaG
MAERIGVKSNTVARWERGELSISEPVAKLIRLIERIEKNPKLKRKLEV